MLAFVLASLVPLYLALDDGGLGDVARQQAAVAFLWATALALAFRVLPRAEVTRQARFVFGAGAMLVAWAALSLLWTESVERTFGELTRDLALVALPVVCLLGLNRATWTAAAAGLSLTALAIPALAIVTRLAPDLLQEARLDAAFGNHRLSFPLDYWNALAGWSAMAAAIGLGWSAHLKRASLRALALAAVPVAGLAVYLTYSRGGVLALCVGGVAAVVLSRNRVTAAVHAVVALLATLLVVVVVRGAPEIATATGDGGALRVAGALLVACAAAAGVALWTSRAGLERARMPKRLVRTLTIAGGVGAVAVVLALGSRVDGNSFNSADPLAGGDPASRLTSVAGTRDELWGSALAAFASRPLAGRGPGTFDLWWQRGGSDREAVRDAHSLYLESLAERGLPGLIIVLAFLALLLIGALAARRVVRRSSEIGAAAGLTAGFLAFLTHAAVDWMWEATAVAALALGAGAIVAAGLAQQRLRVSRSLPVRVGLVVAAIVAGMIQVPALVSEQRVRASQAALAAGDEDQARRLADDAVGAQPWAASPYAWRGNLELRDGRLASARRDARAAVSREQTNPAHLFLLVRIEIERDDDAAASRALRDFGKLSPSFREAAEAARRALLEPEEPIPAGLEP
ncbi:MAG: O-antigen ligase family protein [Actinomycetota bacterium]|nr:O-antigen ligase family protein [Actinomycetota bacterium]